MEFKNYNWTARRVEKEISQVNRELDRLIAIWKVAGPMQRGNLSHKIKVKEKVLARLRREIANYENGQA